MDHYALTAIPLQHRTVMFAVFYQPRPPQRVDCLAPRWH